MYMGHQLVELDILVVDHRQTGADDLTQIVRWDGGCHANCDTG